ncbi:MAG TPA: neuromedin U [Terriglobales bacterium]
MLPCRSKILRLVVAAALISSAVASAQTQPSSANASGPGASTEDLQKATQNPVANLISVPFQDNVDENAGPYARDKNTLNIQPVIPFQISQKWNLIPRIITPLIYQPFIDPGNPDIHAQQQLGTFGLGDIQPTFFFSPSKPSKIIWGAGPALLLPTATDDVLGTGKWCAGPSFVALVQPGHFTIGALVSNLWSFAGSSSRADVNTMTLQYFVNYNLKKGWYLTSAPILNANWNAPGNGNVWLVPFGGGVGRIFKIGPQPVNGSVSAYYNVTRPDTIPSPTWQLRLQLALLYPRMPKPNSNAAPAK